ncbi:uncharacterized protein LOC134288388 [Aedes albopictus]|uniref:Reverse transcriptase Ty1/copia-type domain-containing protein n=1 Tax=Aedes albopictus TaxID=7160 RepID=A0ABM1YHB5_AEDAL
MRQPGGFEIAGQEKKVCKLVKSIYGPKQLARDSEEKIGKIYAALSKEFEMVNLGDANYFLGIEIRKEGGKYGISLESYKDRIAERFGLGDAKCAKTKAQAPMDDGFIKTREDGPPLKTNTQYRTLVGA